MPALHHNHPEAAEHTPVNRVAAATPTETPAPRESVKDRFLAWRAANPDTSNAQIARYLGVNGSYVSQYITKAPEDFPGDLARMELSILDFLRGRALKQSFEFPTIQTEVSKAVAGFADYVRSAGGVGVLYGDAGLGKSVGLALAAADTKTGILITASTKQRDANGVTQLLWPHTSNGYKQNSSRWTHIISVLKDTNRLIMVDSAQRLIADGRHTLCDLFDQTGCPILLAGNPNILQKLRADDQQYSRTLPAMEAVLRKPETVVSHILRCLIPDHAEDLLEPACDIARRKGHLRQMVNQIKATIALASSPEFRGKSIHTAWASARALSVDTKTAA